MTATPCGGRGRVGPAQVSPALGGRNHTPKSEPTKTAEYAAIVYKTDSDPSQACTCGPLTEASSGMAVSIAFHSMTGATEPALLLLAETHYVETQRGLILLRALLRLQRGWFTRFLSHGSHLADQQNNYQGQQPQQACPITEGSNWYSGTKQGYCLGGGG